MGKPSTAFRVGTRSSNLALAQTRAVIEYLARMLPGWTFEMLSLSSPGDRDHATDIRESPADFFTRDLDEALLRGDIDFAVHSAKDMPDPGAPGLDWFWLPWREDPRDCLVLPVGKTLAGIPPRPRMGISSQRRAAYCRSRFPDAQVLPIRGNIEDRLAQLDAGRFDAIVMAGAAMIRLGLQDRITQWIPVDELQVPDGQGVLAMTFRSGDSRLSRLRSLFVKPVVFAGAGVGRAGTCTIETIDALKIADVCLYDALVDRALLRHLNPGARLIDAGKRCGSGGEGQELINGAMAGHVRRGERVLRLKGGDPGIFGRLAEEVEFLECLGLPYRVLPGVSSFLAATTGTGMLLTRRGELRGFCVMTSRIEGGGVASVGPAVRAALPQVYFMAAKCAKDILAELQKEGTPLDTPAAFVFDAGAVSECVIRSTVNDIVDKLSPQGTGDKPGLLIVGEAAKHGYVRTNGALGGRRVLLTCSEALQAEAMDVTHDLGGIPVPFPAIRLVPVPAGLDPLHGSSFDWLVLTSPSAVDATLAAMKTAGIDLRALPPILLCGPGTARALAKHGLQAAGQPDSGFGAGSLLALARDLVRPGQRVLRLRSDAAGDSLARDLQAMGVTVTDSVIVRNEPVAHNAIPSFDAVFFASRSAVLSLLDHHGGSIPGGCPVAAIGRPTADELARRGIAPVVVGREATVWAAIEALAVECVRQSLLKEVTSP